MTGATMSTTVVNVRVEQGLEGLFYATSSELKGLLVAEHTRDAAWAAVPYAIKDMYEACGVPVMVTPASTHNEDIRPWVAMPIATAEAALASYRARA